MWMNEWSWMNEWMNEWMDEEGPYSKLQHLLIPLQSLLLTPGTEWT